MNIRVTSTIKIAVVGLGYVGLPLARLMATKYQVVGFDIDDRRVQEIKSGLDSNKELSADELDNVLIRESVEGPGLFCSNDIKDIADCNHYILTIPTPIDEQNNPNLGPLLTSCKLVGSILKNRDLVLFESTVYPGVTEEECVPVLEQASGLIFNKDFFVGYSPERINPGDTEHTLEKIVKITSGSTPEIAEKVDALYGSVITAGTFKARSIKVAEAAKVIENAQRDINIAFVNELSKIFNLMDIDTHEVLEAAGTKWNFMPFTPGLVGGHCIGVDPFYLAYKAQEIGYDPEIILAGRKMNDGMSKYVASEVIKLMVQREIKIIGSNILVLGLTFKENCSDIRNTKSVDLINELDSYGAKVVVYDPWASAEEARLEFGIELSSSLPNQPFEVIIHAVSHNEFQDLDYRDMLNERGILYDIKGVLDLEVDGRL